jgi:hypothetical protein
MALESQLYENTYGFSGNPRKTSSSSWNVLGDRFVRALMLRRECPLTLIQYTASLFPVGANRIHRYLNIVGNLRGNAN